MTVPEPARSKRRSSAPRWRTENADPDRVNGEHERCARSSAHGQHERWRRAFDRRDVIAEVEFEPIALIFDTAGQRRHDEG